MSKIQSSSFRLPYISHTFYWILFVGGIFSLLNFFLHQLYVYHVSIHVFIKRIASLDDYALAQKIEYVFLVFLTVSIVCFTTYLFARFLQYPKYLSVLIGLFLSIGVVIPYYILLAMR